MRTHQAPTFLHDAMHVTANSIDVAPLVIFAVASFGLAIACRYLAR